MEVSCKGVGAFYNHVFRFQSKSLPVFWNHNTNFFQWPSLLPSQFFWFKHSQSFSWASLVAQIVKCLPTLQETWVQSLGQEDPLEKEMVIHSSSLAWKITWIEEPGRLQSVGSQRVRHDWVTSLSLSIFFLVTWLLQNIYFFL